MTLLLQAFAQEPVDEAPRASTLRVRAAGLTQVSEPGFVARLRGLIEVMDRLFESLEREPADNSPCPWQLTEVEANLRIFSAISRRAEFSLLSRVVARQLGLVERLQCGRASWGLLVKLGLEELTSVLDMVLDVVELVGSDSGCRQEERVSFRILATIAPQVLAEVDGMSFREIRFHQVATRSGTRAS